MASFKTEIFGTKKWAFSVYAYKKIIYSLVIKMLVLYPKG